MRPVMQSPRAAIPTLASGRPMGGPRMMRKQQRLSTGMAERETYVERYVVSKKLPCERHAWVTIDGIHAIDITLEDRTRTFRATP